MKVFLKDHKRGATYKGEQFKLSDVDPDTGVKTPMDLTNAAILMQLRKTPDSAVALEFTDTAGITITDPPTEGIFEIDNQIVDIDPSTYLFDIRITFANNTVEYHIEGTWKILPNISR